MSRSRTPPTGWLDRLLGATAAWWPAGRGRGGTPAFAPTGVEIAADLAAERVLVLAPHPDDEVIGPGATLARHAAAGSRVTVVYLTDGAGAGGDREGLGRTRRREAEAVGDLLGCEQIFWDHPDTRLDPAAALGPLTELLTELAPDTIFVTSFFERHYDHYAANALLDRALERSGSEATICGYEVWDALPSPEWAVDISEHLETKIDCMTAYATPMEYTDFTQLIRARAELHYLLHVDSARRSPPGAAEAFTRSSAATFRERFRSWDQRLRVQGSPLTEHLDAL